MFVVSPGSINVSTRLVRAFTLRTDMVAPFTLQSHHLFCANYVLVLELAFTTFSGSNLQLVGSTRLRGRKRWSWGWCGVVAVIQVFTPHVHCLLEERNDGIFAGLLFPHTSARYGLTLFVIAFAIWCRTRTKKSKLPFLAPFFAG